MELVIYNRFGENTNRTLHVDDEVFAVKPNFHTIYLDIKLKLANLRQGTHKTKGKSEVSGSTRKIKKQKGTGGARAGSIKSPLFVGGATAFGPVVRDYSFKLNKKVMRLAKRSALSLKAGAGNLLVLEDFQLDRPKTSTCVEVLGKLNLAGKKVLLLLGEKNTNLVLSARNLPNVTAVEASSVSTYDLMKSQFVVVLESAVPVVETVFK